MSGREKKRSADHIRLLFLIFVSAVCVLFLLKLRWPKTKSIYDQNTFCIYCFGFLLSFKTSRYIEFISIHLEGASIRGLFFCSVVRRSSAGGGRRGGGWGSRC